MKFYPGIASLSRRSQMPDSGAQEEGPNKFLLNTGPRNGAMSWPIKTKVAVPVKYRTTYR